MKYLSLSFLLLIGFNVFVFYAATMRLTDADLLKLFFLDVGQGDSELIVLPEGSRILVDGGPDKGISFQLEKVLPPTSKYIDLVILSHAEKDHLGGLGDLLLRYQVGAFLWNGRDTANDAWSELKNVLSEHNIPIVELTRGDRIVQGESIINIVSPASGSLNGSNHNEQSLIFTLESQEIKVLYTGDIGIQTENKLVEKSDLDIDVLKVAHHGSRLSTSIEFLKEATPAIAVIEVGNNNYGHPHPTTLQKLRMAGVSVYRTDENGTVSLLVRDGVVGVRTER